MRANWVLAFLTSNNMLYLLCGSSMAMLAASFIYIHHLRKCEILNSGSHPDGWQFTDVQTVLAVGIFLLFSGVIFTFLYHPPAVDSGSKEVLLILIGALVAKFGDAYAYFFNSTQQATRQTEAAKNTSEAALKTAATTAATAATVIDKLSSTGNGHGPDTASSVKTTTETVVSPGDPPAAIVKVTHSRPKK